MQLRTEVIIPVPKGKHKKFLQKNTTSISDQYNLASSVATNCDFFWATHEEL